VTSKPNEFQAILSQGLTNHAADVGPFGQIC